MTRSSPTQPRDTQTASHRLSRTFASPGADATRRLGELLAPLLRPGDVLPLWGGFGAGKTTFVQGVGRGLGAARPVVSPSFGLLHTYESPLRPGFALHHLDLYRIGSLDEARVFGVEEALLGEGAALVEWPEVVLPLLPADRLEIAFEARSEQGDEADEGGDEPRTITFGARGERSSALLRELAALAPLS